MSGAPKPPYWAAIFSSQRTDADPSGYAATARRMEELARRRPGFLGVESARGADGFGITVSYWESLDAIAGWKADAEHQAAQKKGREVWYKSFHLRIARVEREGTFP